MPEGEGVIRGSDRDAGAIEQAEDNAARAKVSERVQLEVVTVGSRELLPELRGGVLVTNPPWGLRTGKPEQLVGLYRGIGNLARRLGMDLAMWSSRWDLMRASHAALEPLMHTELGGVKVTLAGAKEPEDSRV